MPVVSARSLTFFGVSKQPQTPRKYNAAHNFSQSHPVTQPGEHTHNVSRIPIDRDIPV